MKNQNKLHQMAKKVIVQIRFKLLLNKLIQQSS